MEPSGFGALFSSITHRRYRLSIGIMLVPILLRLPKQFFRMRSKGNNGSHKSKLIYGRGQLDAVIAACREHLNPPRDDDPAQKAVTYYTNNRHRMDYATYRAKGYQIGSGSMESGCKQLGLGSLKNCWRTLEQRWGSLGRKSTSRLFEWRLG